MRKAKTTLVIPKKNTLVLFIIQVLQEHLLQCGLALGDSRHNTTDLLQVALHALHMAPDLLRKYNKLVFQALETAALEYESRMMRSEQVNLP